MHKADPDWSAYLVSTVRDFVVWGMPPVGSIDQAKAEWLIGLLSASKGSKAPRTIVREATEQACEVDDALLAALGRTRRIRVELSRDAEAVPDAEEQGGTSPGSACDMDSTSVNQMAA